MASGTMTPTTGDTGTNYFTVAELRAYKPELTATLYSDAKVVLARDWAEQQWEQTFNAAFVSRTSTYTAIGDGRQYLTLPHFDVTAVSSATVGGVALTASEIADLVVYPHGMIRYYGGWTIDTPVVVNYAYGKTTVPAPVKLAVMLLACEYLVEDNLASRATSESTDVGFIRLSYAQPGRTGIPEVDKAGADFGHSPVVKGSLL